MSGQPASCARCGATLKFVVMAETGKRLPVNAIPDPHGLIAARWTGERWAGGHTLAQGAEARPGFKRFRSHFADCRPDEVKKTRGESAASRLF